MTDEEKKAIENVKKQLEGIKKANECGLATKNEFKEDIESIETVLNLIKKQQAELEKKDKIIDLMTEKFENLRIAYFKKEDGGEFMGNYTPYNKNDWKQYFEKKAEGRI